MLTNLLQEWIHHQLESYGQCYNFFSFWHADYYNRTNKTNKDNTMAQGFMWIDTTACFFVFARADNIISIILVANNKFGMQTMWINDNNNIKGIPMPSLFFSIKMNSSVAKVHQITSKMSADLSYIHILLILVWNKPQYLFWVKQGLLGHPWRSWMIWQVKALNYVSAYLETLVFVCCKVVCTTTYAEIKTW